MVRIYFVRHAQPEHEWEEDRTRPLTIDGEKDSKKVLEFFKDKHIDKFYSSPYKRSIDTIAESAKYFGKEIMIDQRLREREKGPNGNNHGMFQKRWADHNFHEEGGESIAMVQERNMAALQDILQECSCNMEPDKENKNINIVIGTHGTALSSILSYYDKDFNCDAFLRIIDWMPFIIELDFENEHGNLVNKIEHLHIEKEFKGKERADKATLSKNVIGKIVTVTVDRPLGTYHPEYKDMYYPVNYGYIEGIMAPDGEEQDAYILGVSVPVETFVGKIIAVIHRKDDVEEKWVVCPENMSFSQADISQLVQFQEQYFDSKVHCN